MTRRTITVALLALASLATGCVTETRPVTRAAPVRTDQQTTQTRTPIVEPVETPTASSRIVVGVTPIGSIPYDAQVLPLISPDGNSIATQTGDAPNWPTLLAEPGATPTLGTKLRIYDITGRAPKEVTPRIPLPPSLLLGRSADAEGFLVESPRLDGSRRIGKVSWTTGELTWLTDGVAINAFATLSTEGDLVWMRLADNQPTIRLRTRAGEETEQAFPATVRRVFPAFTNDPTTLYLFELTTTGIDLAARPIANGTLGPTIARRRITSIPDPFLVYQSLAAIASPVHAKGADPRLAFVHPTQGRVNLFDPRTATLTPMADGSIACAPIHDGQSPGYTLTTPEGLVYQRLTSPDPDRSPSPPTRMLAEDHVPRATSNPAFPTILISPSKDSPGRLNLTRINLPEHTP